MLIILSDIILLVIILEESKVSVIVILLVIILLEVCIGPVIFIILLFCNIPVILQRFWLIPWILKAYNVLLVNWLVE